MSQERFDTKKVTEDLEKGNLPVRGPESHVRTGSRAVPVKMLPASLTDDSLQSGFDHKFIILLGKSKGPGNSFPGIAHMWWHAQIVMFE